MEDIDTNNNIMRPKNKKFRDHGKSEEEH